MRVNCVCLYVNVNSQHASRGPMVLPVPSSVSARLGCPVTMRQGGVDAQLGPQGLAVRDVRIKRNSNFVKQNLITQLQRFYLVKFGF